MSRPNLPENDADGRRPKVEAGHGGVEGRLENGPILWLDGTGAPRRKVGGKGHGLNRLIAAGFLVPEAFCVTTDAFTEVVEGLVDGAATIEELRELILTAELDQELIDAVAGSIARTGAQSFAVRSSSVEEDESAHSFAGQQATVLGARGIDEVLTALRKVWASLYDVEGLLYRSQLDVGVVPRPMAVVIQPMVAPGVAGVLFTANPLTGDRREIVVSAASGLGESVVSGRASTTVYLDKDTGKLRRPAGSAEGLELFSSELLAELGRAAEAIEAVFGAPQDIEWAYVPAAGDGPQTEGKLYFLQSRPITFELAQPQAPSVWTNANVGEALPGVATPLTWSIIRNFSRKGFEQAFGTMGLTVPEDYGLVGSFRGRVYLNLTQFMSVASGIPILKPDRLYAMAGGGGASLVKDVYAQRSHKEFWQRLPVTVPKIAAAQLAMPVIAPLWGRYFKESVDDFYDRDLSAVDRGTLREALTRVDRLFDRTGLVMLTTSSNFLMSYVITAELLKILGGPQAARREQELFAGVDVKSAEPGLALLELGRLVRRSPGLKKIFADHPPAKTFEALMARAAEPDVAAFLTALDDFRRDHGHRAPREAELSTPRWREETGFLFEVLKSFVDAPQLPSTFEVDRERRRARDVAQGIIEANFAGPLKGIFRFFWSYTRANARLREATRDNVVESLALYRHFFLECGRRLVVAGVLRAPDDVFFLTYDEIRRWLEATGAAHDFAIRVLVRRRIFEALEAQPDPPDTFMLRGTELIPEEEIALRIHTSEDEREGTYLEIKGLPASAGKVTGRARIIHDPNREDAVLRPGEILVAPYTDVGWTPLFLTASAVVMSLGGPLSHSSIVAREYGIPAVVNAKRATEIIRTGDLITVDGDNGVVLLRQSPSMANG